MSRILLVILSIVFLSSCSSPSSKENTNENSSISDLSELPTEYPEKKSSFPIDSLNSEYRKRGFESFCEVKADADSIFLTADYMAGIALGEDNFGPERTKLTSRIEKDRIAVYIKKHGIDYKILLQDLMLLAMEYPNPCQSYLQYRYDVDKAMIRNERSVNLHQDVYMNYK